VSVSVSVFEFVFVWDERRAGRGSRTPHP